MTKDHGTSQLLDAILGPRTVTTAMDGIRRWDRRAGSLPLLSEQLLLMGGGPNTWSTTHCWPSVRGTMVSLGLVRELEPTRLGKWVIPTTEITELGHAVRAALTA